MAKNISRRNFLKGGAFAACAFASSSLPDIASADVQKHLATLLDIRKCVGCGACVDACRETNPDKFLNPKKPFPAMFPARVKSEDWSDQDTKEVRDRLTPYNWLYIQSVAVEINGKQIKLTIPRRCMHCVNPPCVKLCTWGSALQLENGISRIDKELCLGGAKCKSVCPWKIPQRQTGAGLYLEIMPKYMGNGIMNKCDRCYSLVAQGKLPACIEVCPEGVQTIGTRHEIIAKANKPASEINGYIYGEKENGGTNTIYVSPVPFENLNKVIEKGEGKPHFNLVEDSMEKANNIITALFIAPVVGALAAFGKFYRFTKKNDQQGEPK